MTAQAPHKSQDTITIRPASSKDIPDITQIYAHSVMKETATFEEIPPSETEMHRRWAVLKQSGHPWFVATLSNAQHVIGYAYAAPYNPRSAFRYVVENSIYIDPAYRRNGAGKSLLRSLISACIDRGYRQMFAQVGDSRNLASLELHECFGFEKVGLLSHAGYKAHQWLDVVILQKRLGAGSSIPPE